LPIKLGVVLGTTLLDEEVFRRVKAFGFNGVEVFAWRLSKDEREKMVKTLVKLTKDHALKVSDIGGGPSLVDLGLPTESEKSLALAKDFLEIAHKVDTPISLIPSFRAPPEAKKEDVLANAGFSLKKLDKAAQDLGVYLTIEPLNRYETNLLALMDQTVGYIDDLGTERVKLMADLYHMSIEETSLPDALRSAAKHLVHMHVSENHGGLPGTGTIPYGAVFRTLKNLRYEGFMSIEFHKNMGNVVEAYGKALPYLKAARDVNYV